jgi:hypothetical protein
MATTIYRTRHSVQSMKRRRHAIAHDPRAMIPRLGLLFMALCGFYPEQLGAQHTGPVPGAATCIIKGGQFLIVPDSLVSRSDPADTTNYSAQAEWYQSQGPVAALGHRYWRDRVFHLTPSDVHNLAPAGVYKGITFFLEVGRDGLPLVETLLVPVAPGCVVQAYSRRDDNPVVPGERG